jgi:hypothetical protein
MNTFPVTFPELPPWSRVQVPKPSPRAPQILPTSCSGMQGRLQKQEPRALPLVSKSGLSGMDRRLRGPGHIGAQRRGNVLWRLDRGYPSPISSHFRKTWFFQDLFAVTKTEEQVIATRLAPLGLLCSQVLAPGFLGVPAVVPYHHVLLHTQELQKTPYPGPTSLPGSHPLYPPHIWGQDTDLKNIFRPPQSAHLPPSIP